MDIKTVFISLMEKLSKFAQQQPSSGAKELECKTDIFKLFKKYTDKIIEGTKQESVKLLELETAFMNFCIKTYPQNVDYVNLILESVYMILKSNPIQPSDKTGMNLLVKLLSTPLDSLSIKVLRMQTYPQLMSFMKFTNKRQVALRICKAVIKEGHYLTF